MLKNVIIIIFSSIILFSCSNEKKKSTDKIDSSNPYLGTWTRSFEMGPEVKAQVTYTFKDDEINYEMNGPMKLNYTIVKDTFLIKDKRFIGVKDSEMYVVFIKDDTKESLTILKMKVESKEKALNMPFPSAEARSKFSSWNTYKRE